MNAGNPECQRVGKKSAPVCLKERRIVKRLSAGIAGFLILTGCATSTTQTHFIDAQGRECWKTFKKVAPLGIAVSESVECSENPSSLAAQKMPPPKIHKKYFFGWF